MFASQSVAHQRRIPARRSAERLGKGRSIVLYAATSAALAAYLGLVLLASHPPRGKIIQHGRESYDGVVAWGSGTAKQWSKKVTVADGNGGTYEDTQYRREWVDPQGQAKRHGPVTKDKQREPRK
jgi:hypothetical protein